MLPVRDWRYIGPILGLVAITAAGVVLAGTSGNDAGAVAAPTVTAVASPAATASAQPTSDLGAILLDSRRKLDLATLRDALETFKRRFGIYPTTNSQFQTACSNNSEAACALNAVASKLSFSDGARSYQYRSDGASYTLYSEIATADATSRCSGEVPPNLAGHSVFCVSSEGGGQ